MKSFRNSLKLSKRICKFVKKAYMDGRLDDNLDDKKGDEIEYLTMVEWPLLNDETSRPGAASELIILLSRVLDDN